MRGKPLGLVATVLAACTNGSTTRPARNAPMVDAEGFVRTCESAVFGDPNLRNALTVGPLILVGVREAATTSTRTFQERHGRYQAIKILAVVRGSDDVTVSVPVTWREHVALLYDPAAEANRYGFRLSQGHSEVTFEACPGTDAQYNGGFLATRPDCVRLIVELQGSEPLTGWMSLGAGRSSCPT
jgi:hypothetical protein